MLASMNLNSMIYWVTRLMLILLLWPLLGSNLVFAQVLDRIDVEERSADADIVIRFNERIQYRRHVPKEDGKLLRIFFVLADNYGVEEELMQETLSTRKTDRMPKVTVTYPELINAMLVTFPVSTKFSVRPGTDDKSIIITIPLAPIKEPAAKDLPVRPSSSVSGDLFPAVPPPQPASVESKTDHLPAPVISSKQVASAVSERVTPISPVPIPTVVVAQPGAPVMPTALESSQVSTEEAKEKPTGDVSPGLTEAPAELQVASELPQDMSLEETEAKASAYMTEARQAMAGKDPLIAINRLNRILGMASNHQTEPAQALIGEAREMNGEIAKAKAEYQLYLKLFPEGNSVDKVRQRLAAITVPEKSAKTSAPRVRPKDTGPTPWMFFGNLSVNQYRGKSRIESEQTTPASLTPTTQKLSMVDQDSLVTSINLNARHRDAVSDTRLVFRDTNLRNTLTPDRSYNRVYSAYGEHTDRDIGYFIRGGRQNPAGSGVMSRFDGVTGYYSLMPELRVGAVYGDAVEFNTPYKRSFYGLNAEYPAEAGRPGVNLYMIEQTIDGYLDRRAVGSEVRYFDGSLSGFAILDYDTLYKDINIAMLQGNYLTEGGDSYYVMYDRRRSPSYGLTNALGLPGFDTIRSMVDQFGESEMRRMVKGNTALSEMMSAGVTHKLSSDWQIGGDYRTSKISGTNPVQLLTQLCPDFVAGDPTTIQTCTVSGQPITLYCSSIDIVNGTCTTSAQGSGTTRSYSLQLLGSNLFHPNAVGVGFLSYTEGETYKGKALGLNYTLPFLASWRFDANMNYYVQNDNAGGKAERISPNLKLSYQWGNSLNLEAQIGQDVARNSTTTSSDRSTRNYIYSGARWDLR